LDHVLTQAHTALISTILSQSVSVSIESITPAPPRSDRAIFLHADLVVFLVIMATGVPLGLAIPVLARIAKNWLSPVNDLSSWVYTVGSFLPPCWWVFLSLNLFYRVAPRRQTRFAEVWIAALGAKLFLTAIRINHVAVV
jgi:uncharacterized BrkB/YihY/UPF0761 family membrane protein